MSYNNFNIAVFESTMKRINNTPSIYKDVETAAAAQEYYFGDVAYPSVARFSDPCKVIISKNRTVEAGRKHLNGTDKVCILNFASATRPGGGVTNGSSAQEECICRVSGLYKCLCVEEAMNNFYRPHQQKVGPLHNDDIIYTPNVPIVKTDDYDLLIDTVYLDILTCAAPNLRERNVVAYNDENAPAPTITDDELYQIHVSRAKQIMNVAAAHNVDVLILGAFGCGAFKNNPNVVAKAYKDVLPYYEHLFKVIEFAIFSPKGKPTDNYDAFKKEFTK